MRDIGDSKGVSLLNLTGSVSDIALANQSSCLTLGQYLSCLLSHSLTVVYVVQSCRLPKVEGCYSTGSLFSLLYTHLLLMQSDSVQVAENFIAVSLTD